MTLGVLALDFSTYMRDDATAALNLSEETRAYYVAVAGMQRALYENTRERRNNPAAGQAQPVNPSQNEVDFDGDGIPDTTEFQVDGKWHEKTFRDVTFAVRLVGEDGKIPLNVDLTEDMSFYQEVLRHVVTNLVRGGNQTTGVDKDTEEDISTIVDSILDWRDCDDEEHLNGAETKYYNGLPRPYSAKNGFFDAADELMRIKGVTPDIFYGHDDLPGLVDVFTPFPRGEPFQLNLDQITPDVIKALSADPLNFDWATYYDGKENDPEGIKVWLGVQLDTAIPGMQEHFTTEPPRFVRVEARADTKQQRNQSGVVAIVELAGTEQDEPIFHSWLDRSPLRGEGPTHEQEPGAGTS
jgi:hypothetical protein